MRVEDRGIEWKREAERGKERNRKEERGRDRRKNEGIGGELEHQGSFQHFTNHSILNAQSIYTITDNNSSYGRHSLSSSSQYNTQSFIRRLTKEVKDTANTLRL